MRLKSTAYMLLGMLRLGATSGYDLKKKADASTNTFWPTSLAQVYPELASLERQGLVSRRDDSLGARRRSMYSITETGEEVLLAWLRSEREVPVQFRDEGLLRLFFADALPAEDQLALVRRLRERASNGAAMRRVTGVGEVAPTEAEGVYFPTAAARFGTELWAFSEQWLAALEAEVVQRTGADGEEADGGD